MLLNFHLLIPLLLHPSQQPSGGEKIALETLKDFRGADIPWFEEVFDAMMILR